MNPVIIIALAFVLLIPTTAFAQYMGNVGDQGQTGTFTLEEALELQKRGIEGEAFLLLGTDKKSYIPGEQIRLFGISSEEQRLAVNVQQFKPNGDERGNTGFSSENDGTFSQFLTAMEPSGLWTFRVKAGNTEAEITVLVLEPLPKPTPLIWSDKSEYEFGDSLIINGDIFDKNKKIILEIMNSKNQTILKDSFIPSLDGRFSKQYTASSPEWEISGTHTVIASSGEQTVNFQFYFTGIDSICGQGTIWVDGKCIPEKKSSKGGGCLIATATYGSELAPQVQQLRELRDNKLLETKSGTSFINSFNEFYYSFSPYIADYERENPVFREMVKIAITPMISSLSILNYVDMDSEIEVLGYGISLIVLNLIMYVGIPVIVIMRIRK